MSPRFFLTLAALAVSVGVLGTAQPSFADDDDNGRGRQQWRDFRNGGGSGNNQQWRDSRRQQRQNWAANNGRSNWGGFGNGTGSNWRERLANMSPEDRQQLRKKMLKHRRKMAQRMGGFAGNGGFGGGCGQNGGGFGGGWGGNGGNGGFLGGGNGGGFLGGGNGGGFLGGGNGGGFFGGGNGQMGNLPPGLQQNLSRMQNGSFPGQGNGLSRILGL